MTTAALIKLETIDDLVNHLCAGADVQEMRTRRGSARRSTGLYQIRVKSARAGTARDQVLNKVQHVLEQLSSQSLVDHVLYNERSPHSGKFSSISFTWRALRVDLVLAQGANRGEQLEAALLAQLDQWSRSRELCDQTEQVLSALHEGAGLDPASIQFVKARDGSTKRSHISDRAHTGKIIADIVAVLDTGEEKYISVKARNGGTIANFGVGGAFHENFSINHESAAWQQLIAPFGVDPERIERGLKEYVSGHDSVQPDTDYSVHHHSKGSTVHELIANFWGSNYIYLRENSRGWSALDITDDVLHNKLLKNLKTVQISYPSRRRKQLTIYLVSDTKRYTVSIRNASGKIIPSELKFSLMADQPDAQCNK